jgi:opacity protein-like surface antigen
MRRTLIHSALLLLCSSSLWAADASGNRWRLSILASEISAPSSDAFSSEETHAGVSLGIAYAPTAQWDVELTAASQTHISPYARLFFFPGPEGTPGTVYSSFEYRRYRVTPLDLSVTRHFRTDQAIAPYVRAGVRYVESPGGAEELLIPTPGPFLFNDPNGLREGFGLSDRLSTQAGAGVRIRMTPRTAVRAEVNRLLRSEGVDFDPLTRYAVGLSWMF